MTRGGYRCQHDVPDEPGLIVGRIAADHLDRSPTQTEPVAPEIPEDRDQRAQVQRHVEGEIVDELALPAGGPFGQNEMARTADRKELGEPLNDAENDRFEYQERTLISFRKLYGIISQSSRDFKTEMAGD